MACNNFQFGYRDQTVSGEGSGLFHSAISSPYLIGSNNPETLPSFSGVITLYKGEIPFESTRRYRLWLWHLNNTGVTVTFGLRVHVKGSATLTNIARHVEVAPFADPSVQGICEAKAHLFSTLDPVSGSFNLSSNSVAVWTQSVPDTTQNGSIIGCCMEFDVSNVNEEEDLLHLRVFATKTASHGSYGDTVAPSDQRPRGWWPRSSMRIRMNPQNDPFDCDPTTGLQSTATGVCESGGPEHHAAYGFGAQAGPGHEHDVANVGCYGVDLVYICEIENRNSTLASECHVSIRSKNGTGAKYWGASRGTLPSVMAETGIRKIPYDLANPNELNAVNPFEDLPGGRIPLAPLELKTVELRLANGGAAMLPCAIFLAKPSMIAEEAEDPDV